MEADRRRFLGQILTASGALVAAPAMASLGGNLGGPLAGTVERSLALRNLHTGERVRAVYWSEGQLVADGLADINRVLRDHRSGEIHPIDADLLDMLYILHSKVGARNGFEVISGYRSATSNAKLRKTSSGVARKSLHMQGKAIDIRLPGHDLKDLRNAALAMRAGGVGFYSKSNFIHVDTGRVRRW